MVCAAVVPSLVSVTVAPGRTPPLASSTCPRSVAVVEAWAPANTVEERRSRTKPARTAHPALGQQENMAPSVETPTNHRAPGGPRRQGYERPSGVVNTDVGVVNTDVCVRKKADPK